MLLDDIIDLATDNKQPITTLLRKCVVLAHQLKNERLKTWANEELNGYTSAEQLPTYRVLSAGATGLFVGPGWGRFQQGIPSVALKKEHRMWAEKVYLMQSVGTLDHMLESEKDTLWFPWNDNLVAHYREELISGWTLFSAHQAVPKSAIAGIVDTARTRVLNMALEIKAELGKADADLEKLTPQLANRVDQTIVNNIYGGGTVYVSTGDSTMQVQQQQLTIVSGDWSRLEKVLNNAGITGQELDELLAAIKSDGDHKLEQSGTVMK